MTVPRSTLRLQFHRGFTFDDAAKHVDYFAALGIRHGYASHITTAAPGAPHGYTMEDTSMFNRDGAERHYTELRQLLDARL